MPADWDFSGSYAPEDAIFLLKPVTLAPTSIEEKEAAIQSGRKHYSEMLSPERPPDARYLELFEAALARNGARLGRDIASLAAALIARAPGDEVVLVSLARAGTPIGVLLKRAIIRAGKRAVHYSISIVRDRGIDLVALDWIAARHDSADAVFVDGWTGKGAIRTELATSLAGCPRGFVPFLTVVADPAGRADLAATDDDYLIASGLLNSVVSGLVSRSILNAAVVGPGDFHACVHYAEFAAQDRSRDFVDTIDAHAAASSPEPIAMSPEHQAELARDCDKMVADIMTRTGTRDRNRVKPGIAEATRAVLRRLPERLFVRDRSDPDVAHLAYLAAEKGLPLDPLPANSRYRAVAVIKSLGSE